MINDFLIISFTGKNNSIGLKVNNKFFIKKFQTNLRNNEMLVNNIFRLIKQKKANIDKKIFDISKYWSWQFFRGKNFACCGKRYKNIKGS